MNDISVKLPWGNGVVSFKDESFRIAKKYIIFVSFIKEIHNLKQAFHSHIFSNHMKVFFYLIQSCTQNNGHYAYFMNWLEIQDWKGSTSSEHQRCGLSMLILISLQLHRAQSRPLWRTGELFTRVRIAPLHVEGRNSHANKGLVMQHAYKLCNFYFSPKIW